MGGRGHVVLIPPRRLDVSPALLRSRGVAKLHPGYDNQVGWDNDIAVVLLDNAFNFRTFAGRVAPVCLAR